ncbi:LysR substrate-binding domain-containing protein [Rhizobium sp. SG2393]|uniref:LysR substrate-binding domain-containing protein n=1 Tax=Rhizobium sp. SG2393 TaxID=3276279 RepID=UPI00366FEDC8
MRRLPPLSALPAFEATARLGSLTAAAEELGRTHGAISKQIAHLAEDLGGDLFEKQGARLKLTSRGERLNRAARVMLDELHALSQSLRAERDTHALDIVSSGTLAARWLIPILPNFYARHPDIEIKLRVTGPHVLQPHEFDVVISYDRLRGPLEEGEPTPVGDTTYGPVCAPGYLLQERDGGWHAPVRLTQSGAFQIWGAWAALTGVSISADREVELMHQTLALESAAAGLGIAMAERRLVASDLATGRLVAPAGFVTVKDGLHAHVTARAKARKVTRLFLDWLKDEAAKV